MVDIELFDAIGMGPGGGITPQGIKSKLAKAGGDDITVRIDSEGGSVFNGFSIYSAFQAYEGNKVCVIESAAFSIASYIAMAFDRVQITSNGYMMIHNPSAYVEGDGEELAKQADLLAKLKASMIDAYSNKTKMQPETIEKMMDRETYLNAEEALAAGFVDEIVDYAKPSRVVEASAEKISVPLRVVASLRNKSDSGESNPLPEEVKPMAVNVKTIKAKFPMASSDFIVKAMEEEMTEEQVAEELLKELAEKNGELSARLAAMEDELAKATAEGDEEEPEAMEEEEEKPVKASRKGAAPVARVASEPTSLSARARWKQAVDGYVAKGLSKQKAAQRANRDNPGLREEMLEELNG